MLSLAGCQGESTANDPLTVTARLVKLLHDPSVDVRRTAALSLGKIAHSAGTEALVQGLTDSDPQVREFSAWGLGQIGEEVNTDAAIALVAALGDREFPVKMAAAHALGRLGPRQPALELLTEALTVGEVGSRRAVVEALMQLEGNNSYPVLRAALKDPDATVRQGAVAALGELGDRRALRDFRRRLLRDSHVGVRTEAAFRIGKLGDEKDLPTLRKAVNQDSTPNVHLWATWAINNVSPVQEESSP